jgi:hypothetical protein
MKNFYNTLISLKIGDRIVVPKSSIQWIQHHAIFLGYENGQYWFIENKEGIGVRVVSADIFFTGVSHITRIVPFNPRYGYGCEELLEYALSKRGKGYHLTNYNCEHLANDIQNHVVKSSQATTGVAIGIFSLALLIGAIAKSK